MDFKFTNTNSTISNMSNRNNYGQNNKQNNISNPSYKRNNNSRRNNYHKSSKKNSHCQNQRKYHNHGLILPLMSQPIIPLPPPLPGTEEYRQRNIEQTSAYIKQQLNIETNNSFVDILESSSFTQPPSNILQTTGKPLCSTPPATINIIPKHKKPPSAIATTSIDVKEIHKKIINYITSLSHQKKVDFVNRSYTACDTAIECIQKEKRLEISRKLREMSKENATVTDNEALYSIIPDIDIKIEDLPKEVMKELSKILNEDAKDSLDTQDDCIVDDEVTIIENAETNVYKIETDTDTLNIPEVIKSEFEEVSEWDSLPKPSNIKRKIKLRRLKGNDEPIDLIKLSPSFTIEDNLSVAKETNSVIESRPMIDAGGKILQNLTNDHTKSDFYDLTSSPVLTRRPNKSVIGKNQKKNVKRNLPSDNFVDEVLDYEPSDTEIIDENRTDKKIDINQLEDKQNIQDAAPNVNTETNKDNLNLEDANLFNTDEIDFFLSNYNNKKVKSDKQKVQDIVKNVNTETNNDNLSLVDANMPNTEEINCSTSNYNNKKVQDAVSNVNTETNKDNLNLVDTNMSNPEEINSSTSNYNNKKVQDVVKIVNTETNKDNLSLVDANIFNTDEINSCISNYNNKKVKSDKQKVQDVVNTESNKDNLSLVDANIFNTDEINSCISNCNNKKVKPDKQKVIVERLEQYENCFIGGIKVEEALDLEPTKHETKDTKIKLKPGRPKKSKTLPDPIKKKSVKLKLNKSNVQSDDYVKSGEHFIEKATQEDVDNCIETDIMPLNIDARLNHTTTEQIVQIIDEICDSQEQETQQKETINHQVDETKKLNNSLQKQEKSLNTDNQSKVGSKQVTSKRKNLQINKAKCLEIKEILCTDKSACSKKNKTDLPIETSVKASNDAKPNIEVTTIKSINKIKDNVKTLPAVSQHITSDDKISILNLIEQTETNTNKKRKRNGTDIATNNQAATLKSQKNTKKKKIITNISTIEIVNKVPVVLPINRIKIEVDSNSIFMPDNKDDNVKTNFNENLQQKLDTIKETASCSYISKEKIVTQKKKNRVSISRKSKKEKSLAQIQKLLTKETSLSVDSKKVSHNISIEEESNISQKQENYSFLTNSLDVDLPKTALEIVRLIQNVENDVQKLHTFKCTLLERLSSLVNNNVVLSRKSGKKKKVSANNTINKVKDDKQLLQLEKNESNFSNTGNEDELHLNQFIKASTKDNISNYPIFKRCTINLVRCDIKTESS